MSPREAIGYLVPRLPWPWTPVLLLLWPAALLGIWVTAPLDFQACLLSTDDSFYYYSFAQNLAAGRGPTVDGLVPTNGVQPLWAALLTLLAVFARGDHALVTAVLTCALLCLVLAGAFWSRVAWRLGGPWFGWAVALVWAHVMLTHQWALLTGMEISLNIALAGALAAALLDLHDRGWRHPVAGPLLLGALCGLFVLGRLDHVLALAGLAVVEFSLRLAGRRGLWPALGWRHLALVAAPAAALLTPYLLWNKLAFGHWLPVSGAIKLWQHERMLAGAESGSIERLRDVVIAGWRNLARPTGWSLAAVTDLQAWQPVRGAVLAVGLLMTLAMVPARQRGRASALLLLLLAAALPRAMVHADRLNPRDLAYAAWYLTLAWPLGLLLVGHAVWRLLALVPRWHGAGEVLRAGIIVAACLSFLPGWRARLQWEVDHGDLTWRAPMAKVDALRWAERNLSDDAALGSFNSGVLHYYAQDRPVANLDGRVDDGSLLATLQAGGSSLEYLRDRGVTHLIDTPVDDGLWRELLARGEVLHARPYGRDGSRRVVVLAVPPPLPSPPP